MSQTVALIAVASAIASAALAASSLDDLIVSPVEKIAGSLQFTEGPVWHPDGYLLFSDIPADKIYRWDGEALSTFRHPSHNSNGLVLDRQGRLIACEHGSRRVTRTERDGHITILASHWEGKQFNSPNDAAVKSDGSIYFTDPPYGLNRRKKELPFQGVFRIGPDGTLALLADDFDKPNGLAFSPDERVLYVADTARRHVRAFDVQADGTLANGRVFAETKSPQRGGPDGMKVDTAGRVYVTGPGGTWVFDRAGKHLGTIVTPEQPANCAFGGEGSRTLFITARKSVYRVGLNAEGLPRPSPHSP